MLDHDIIFIRDQISKIQSISGKKSCVYFCLFGPYDNIDQPKVFEEQFDYYIISDQDIHKQHFNIIKINISGSQRRANRYFKINPHIFFQSYDNSIYLDSNIIIKGSLYKLQKTDLSADFIIFQHNKRNCVYDEVSECIKWKRDSTKILKKHREILKIEGIKKNSGLLLGAVLLRKHHNLVDFSSLWWSKYTSGSSRDQISLMQSLHVHHPKMFVIPFNQFESYFTRKLHSQLDITEKNLNTYEQMQLWVIRKIYRLFKWLKKL